MVEKHDWTITQQTVVAKPEELNTTYSMKDMTNISIALQVFPRRPRQDIAFMSGNIPEFDASKTVSSSKEGIMSTADMTDVEI